MKNFVFALILAVGLFLPFAQPVQATTVVLTVDADAPFFSGAYHGVPADFSGMNLDDADTSYCQGDEQGGWSFSACPTYVINSVTFYYKVRTDYVWRNVTPSVNKGFLGFAGSASAGSLTYALSSYTWATSPFTGVAWTASELDSCAFKVGVAGGSSTSMYCTYAYLVVDYTATTPTVTTQPVSVITPTTATGNGNVTSDGGSAITERGTVYNTTANPDTGTGTKDTAAGTTGAFTTSIDTLTKGTLYHVRAYGINAIGTSYGSDESFTTINDPTISTVAASLVTESTARLNSQVTFDGAIGGGELCTVTFAYKIGTLATYDLCAAGAEVVAGTTYTVNQLPYVDIASLTGSSTYSFAVKISNSTGTDVKSAAITFGTGSGVYIPTNFTAIPTSTTISYAWAKGAGAQYTLVRYSGSAYPATITDGSLGYLNTANSFQLSGITAGTTIYASAWGKTGTNYSGTGPGYSDGKIDVMVTTLAYDSTSTTGSLVTPTPSSTWTQNPDATKVNTIPVFGSAVQAVAVAYNQPVNYLWYFIWILVAVGAAIAVYIRGQFNFVLALSTMIGIIGIGVFWYNLVAGLVVVVLAVIGIGWALVGFRRPGT